MDYYFYQMGDKYYRIYRSQMDVMDALGTCQRSGGWLVEPRNAKQAKILRQLKGK